MGVVVNDTFTEASNTNLVDHTPDTGTSWIAVAETGTVILHIVGVSDTVTSDGTEASDRVVYKSAPDPTEVNYDVEVTLATDAGVGSDDDPWAIFARLVDDDNFYAVVIHREERTPDVKLIKKISGTVTELATAVNAGGNDGDVFRFEVRDTSPRLAVYMNDSLLSGMTSDDTSLTAAGAAGLGMGNIAVTTDDINTGWELDDYTVTEFAAAASTFIVAAMLGL